MARKKSKPQEKKEQPLKIDKRPLEDLPVKEHEEEDVRGGRAPPYSPVRPGR